MEVVKKRTIPAQTKEYVECLHCDLCGAKSHGTDWEKDNYRKAETCVKMEEGDCYPEFSETIETSFHICCNCFKEKLTPWLESQGAVSTKKEISW